ncbi:MAG: glycosyltransferase [Lachnospiraceae bacterium]|nr:glycosyltransferase [Lachnospiraceae bacterium]
MKLLTITVPCYNSQDYMMRCIDSLLPGGDEVEILIVNDGSTDRTHDIAKEYERNFPEIVRVIDQENKGHGGAVNTGIANATGLYFKVVDSDDRLEPNAYRKVLRTLRRFADMDEPVDMLLSNYVYDKEGKARKKAMTYRGSLEEDRILTWENRIHFRLSQYVLMHSVIYRREVLLQSGLKLPEHTFYVDNIYVIQPMPYVKTLYYLNVNLYLYYIGREGQSVNEQTMIRRIDQQLRVCRNILSIQAKDQKAGLLDNKNLDGYVFQYVDMMMCISSIMLILDGSEEALRKKRALWAYAKRVNPVYYRRLRTSLFGIGMNLPGKVGRRVSIAGYRIAQSVFGFN